jgi:hypothetical protein
MKPLPVLSERGWGALASLPVSYRLVDDHAAAALIDGAAPQWTDAAARAIDLGLDLIVLAPAMAAAGELSSLCASIDARDANCIIVPRWSARGMPVMDATPPLDYLDIRVSGSGLGVGTEATALLHSALLIESLGLTAPSGWAASDGGFVAAASMGAQVDVTVVFHETAHAPGPGVAIRAVGSDTVLELDLPFSGEGVPSRARVLEPLRIVEATPVYDSAFRRGLIAGAAALESGARTNDMALLADLARGIESSSGPR